MNLQKTPGPALMVALAAMALMVSAPLGAQQLQDLQITTGDSELRVKMVFDGPPPSPRTFRTQQPARIVLDFMGVRNALARRRHEIGYADARSLAVVSNGQRTRLVVNMQRDRHFELLPSGNNLTLMIRGEGAAQPAAAVAARTPASGRTGARPVRRAPSGHSIDSFDFRRGDDGTGQIVLALSDDKISINLEQYGDRLEVDFQNARTDDDLQKIYDVRDFATPINEVSIEQRGQVVRMIVQVDGSYDYLAYQTANTYTINVQELATQAASADGAGRPGSPSYQGERMSINFVDIEVPAVLRFIAEVAELNLVVSDSVEGSLTLKLDNVPWDQALSTVLRSKGLDSRLENNVLIVAPIAEIAAREKSEADALRQQRELAPLFTEFIQISYGNAADMIALIRGGGESGGGNASLLSERGSASVDLRTNTIIIKDTRQNLESIRRFISRVDIPVPQVLIEARIVIASTEYRKNLGARLGMRSVNNNAFNEASVGVAGSRDILTTLFNPGAADDLGQTLAVDLGASSAPSLALALLSSNGTNLIDLELSALERDGGGEVISRPRIIVGNNQAGSIRSGQAVAFQEASAGGNATAQFREAVLALNVTPQITPDDRVMLRLNISQDAVGEIVAGQASINVNDLNTQVLVNNGETLMLGGILREENRRSVEKVPLFGDIPLIGRIFRRVEQRQDQSELLMFITPRIIDINKNSMSGG